jgi:hypothetical protein
MYIICFNQLKTKEGKNAVCGAVQMTGFDFSKHTLRQDLPCRGCGEEGHYDGYSVLLQDDEHTTVLNGHVKPVREL